MGRGRGSERVVVVFVAAIDANVVIVVILTVLDGRGMVVVVVGVDVEWWRFLLKGKQTKTYAMTQLLFSHIS